MDLTRARSRAGHAGTASSGSGARSFVACSCNLAKAIIGAGMVTVPRAYFMLGTAFGSMMLLIVTLLVLYTVAVLVDGNERYPGTTTYRALSRAACGRWVATLTQASIILFCFGFCVVDLVVVGDLLRGSPPESCNGLLCLLLGIKSGPLVQRSLVLLALSVGVAAPLLLIRSMQRLNPLNYLGIGAALLLSAVAAGLGCTALARGTAHPVPLLPPTRLAPADIISVSAVVLTSFVGHQNLHPVLPLLRPYSTVRMQLVCAAALGISLLVYWVLAVGSSLAFGPALQPNVLANFGVEDLAPILGSRDAAIAASLVVQAGYALAVMASFVLFVQPLRTSLAELIWDWDGNTSGTRGSRRRAVAAAAARDLPESTAAAGGAHRFVEGDVRRSGVALVAEKESKHYMVLTYGILAVTTLAAIAIPDIWEALSAIGDGAASVEAFIVPGLIALAMRRLGSATNRKSDSTATVTQPLLPPTAVEEGAGTSLVGHGAAGSAAGTSSAGLYTFQPYPGDRCKARGGAWGVAAWLVGAGDALLALLVILLGLGLIVNGAAQKVAAAGIFG